VSEGPEKETLLLGDEYDDELRVALGDVLGGLGGRRVDETWLLGGSQVIEKWEVEIDGESLVIEAETYMGLSLVGNRALVRRVRDLVAERRRLASLSPPRK